LIPFNETLLVSENKLTVDHSAGTDNSIFVESNGLWSASVFNNSWLSVESSGVGNDTLKITFSENPDANDRKNRIYVTTNGGNSKSFIVTQLGRPSAIGDVRDSDQVVISPNPTNGEFSIESADGGLLSVYNQSGQKLMELILEMGSNKLDIGKFKNGVYLFRIQTDQKIIVKKVIKN
jgi:hypothetical protein